MFQMSSPVQVTLLLLYCPTLSKAALVGAKRVKGPAAARRSIMPAAFSAVCSVEKCSFSAIRAATLLAAGWGAAGAGAGRGCLVGAWGSRLGLGRRKLGPGRRRAGRATGARSGRLLWRPRTGRGTLGRRAWCAASEKGLRLCNKRPGYEGEAAAAVLSKYYLPRACGGAAAASASEAGV